MNLNTISLPLVCKASKCRGSPPKEIAITTSSLSLSGSQPLPLSVFPGLFDISLDGFFDKKVEYFLVKSNFFPHTGMAEVMNYFDPSN
jgi:hypothetical protein